MYGVDASRYEEDAAKKLYIRRIYDMIPSQMENKKKRIVAKDILDRKGDRFSNYVEEFEYLIHLMQSVIRNIPWQNPGRKIC